MRGAMGERLDDGRFSAHEEPAQMTERQEVRFVQITCASDEGYAPEIYGLTAEGEVYRYNNYDGDGWQPLPMTLSTVVRKQSPKDTTPPEGKS